MTSRLFWYGTVAAGQDVVDHLMAYYKIGDIECVTSTAYVYEDQTDSSLHLEFMLKGYKLFSKHYSPIRVSFIEGLSKNRRSNPPKVMWSHLIEEVAFEVNQMYIRTPEVQNDVHAEAVPRRCRKCGGNRV